ncbi:MAG: hypothetical protein QM758_29220 [Armatimonas sp.]
MRSVILAHAARYPLWEIVDLYKLLHQAAMGAEHAITNETGVRNWLTRELAEIAGQARPEEPFIDPLTPDGALVRVHLRPFLQRGLEPEALLQAFLQTAREITPAPERLTEYSREAIALAEAGELAFESAALEAFFAERAEQGYLAYHHSAQFEEHYRPAYRLIARPFLPPEY